MIRLITLALALASLFASTFIVINMTGVITLADIERWLEQAHNTHWLALGSVVFILLLSDLFIAMPTLTIVILSGYFLGPYTGALFSIMGLWAAGVSGYLICYHFGEGLLLKIYKDPEKLAEMRTLFSRYGVKALLICRATPILPEVTCCLSGITKVSFKTFFTYYSLASLPYAFVAAWIGSKSSLENPLPAIIGGLSMSLCLWLAWYLLIKFHNPKKAKIEGC